MFLQSAISHNGIPPFGRALHSAAILSEKLQLDIKVETDLHEWQANIQTFDYLSDEEAEMNYKELTRHRGIAPQNEKEEELLFPM